MLKTDTDVKSKIRASEKRLTENAGEAVAAEGLSPVAMALERQRNDLGRLDGLVAQLSLRLSPICSDQPVCGKELDKSIAGESALLRTIEDHNTKLADASGKIEYILFNLEV